MARARKCVYAVRNRGISANTFRRPCKCRRATQVQRCPHKHITQHHRTGVGTRSSLKMFYFQYLLNQGLAGIDRTAIVPTVTGIAYTVLLIGFLIGLYQAAMRGGDLQALGITATKYLIVAIILANWSAVFREVNDSFAQLAQFISNSSGAGDMFLSWMDQLK